MTYLLCRNRVADFERWKAVFAPHRWAHMAAGLRLIHLWREAGEAENVFFLFEVASVEQAREFMGDPEAAKAAAAAGVMDGEYHFMEEAEGY
jgi:hypothetical protein